MSEVDAYSSALVTDVQLAAILEVSARRIRQLVESGTLERAARGKFELGPSIRALLEHAAGNGSELQRERTRKVKADADLAELEYARQKGLVAPVDEFRAVWESRFALVRVNLLSMPSRVLPRLIGEHDERRFKATLRDEITQVLRNAADAVPDPSIEPKPDHEDELSM